MEYILYIIYIICSYRVYNLNINHLKIKQGGGHVKGYGEGRVGRKKRGGTVSNMGGGYREVRG